MHVVCLQFVLNVLKATSQVHYAKFYSSRKDGWGRGRESHSIVQEDNFPLPVATRIMGEWH